MPERYQEAVAFRDVVAGGHERIKLIDDQLLGANAGRSNRHRADDVGNWHDDEVIDPVGMVEWQAAGNEKDRSDEEGVAKHADDGCGGEQRLLPFKGSHRATKSD